MDLIDRQALTPHPGNWRISLPTTRRLLLVDAVDELLPEPVDDYRAFSTLVRLHEWTE